MVKLIILTSAHNAEKYIKEYLKSAVSQSFKEFEIAIELVKPSSNEIKIFKKSENRYPFINLNIYEEKIYLPN